MQSSEELKGLLGNLRNKIKISRLNVFKQQKSPELSHERRSSAKILGAYREPAVLVPMHNELLVFHFCSAHQRAPHDSTYPLYVIAVEAFAEKRARTKEEALLSLGLFSNQ